MLRLRCRYWLGSRRRRGERRTRGDIGKRSRAIVSRSSAAKIALSVVGQIRRHCRIMRRNRSEGESTPITLGQALVAQVRLLPWCCWHRRSPDGSRSGCEIWCADTPLPSGRGASAAQPAMAMRSISSSAGRCDEAFARPAWAVWAPDSAFGRAAARFGGKRAPAGSGEGFAERAGGRIMKCRRQLWPDMKAQAPRAVIPDLPGL
jgi:hypothetical protein